MSTVTTMAEALNLSAIPELAPDADKAAELCWLAAMTAAIPPQTYLSDIMMELAPQISAAIRADLCFTGADLRRLAAEAQQQQQQADAAAAAARRTAEEMRRLGHEINWAKRKLAELAEAAETVFRSCERAAS